MNSIFVPYLDGDLPDLSRNPPSSKFRLYSIDVKEKEGAQPWDIRPVGSNISDTIKKFEGLREYFQEKHGKGCCAYFYLTTTLEKGEPVQIQLLDDYTQSVFLGILLAAEMQINKREFKEDWKLACVTGDVEYVKANKKIRLKNVSDIKSKYEDEFLAKAEKTNEKCLFLYVSDKKEDGIPDGENQGKNGNITVKHFTPDDDIKDIACYLFDKELRQKELLGEMKKMQVYDYIKDERFEELVQSINAERRGFFIHGEGGSGKSALAREITRSLYSLNKIYAPVWVKVDNDDVKKRIEKDERDIGKGIQSGEINGIDEYFGGEKGIGKDLRANRSCEVEEYLVSGIADWLLGKDGASMKGKPPQEKKQLIAKELSTENYLIVIDNLELAIGDLRHVMEAIQRILSNLTGRPYVIITSRNWCGESYDVSQELGLLEIKPPVLTEEQIASFIECVADKTSGDCLEEINHAKESGAFMELVKVLLEYLGGNPDLIIASITGSLRYMSALELSDEIKARLGSGEPGIRRKRVQIYEMLFSYLEKIEMQTLCLFLETGYDVPISPEEISKKIRSAERWNETRANERTIKKALRVLYDNNLIYKEKQGNVTLYGIKSVPYHTFLFEKEFLGPKSESGEHLRDMFVDVGLQLDKALQSNQDGEVIKPLLEKMGAAGRKITAEHLISAARYAKSPEVFPLLHGFGCDPDICDEDGLSFCHHAVIGENLAVLDWVLANAKELLNRTDNYGRTVFHHAARNGHTDVLDWLLANAKELLNQTSNDGLTVFHSAAYNGHTDVLDWLLVNAKRELLYQANNNGETVFHYAAGSGHTAVLDWILANTGKELLYKVANYEATVFHYAARNGHTDVLDWLLDNAEKKLLSQANNLELTVFHYAAGNGHTNVLDWLLDNADKELLYQADNGKTTLFNCAAANGHTNVLDWLLDNADKELLYQTDNNGWTVFHYAAYNGHTDVLDWLLANVKKGLLYQVNNLGETASHSAAYSGHIAVLDWILANAKKLLYKADDGGWTICHDAAFSGHIAVLDWILANVGKELLNQTDNYGRTVCYCAAYNDTTVLDWILVNAKELLYQADKTVAHYAASNGHTNVLDWILVNAKELLYEVGSEEKTICHYPASNGDTNVLGWILVNAKELLYQADSEGKTTCHYAALFGRIDSLNWFLINAEKELLNHTDNGGETIFHAAANGRRTAVLDWLLANADKELLNRADNGGLTVCHAAAKESHTSVLDWVFVHAPDLFTRTDNEGRTAFQLAATEGNTAVLYWFHEHGLG